MIYITTKPILKNLILLCIISISFHSIAQRKQLIKKNKISFSSVKPSGKTLRNCWNAIGIDSLDNVYALFGDGESTEDFMIFKHSTSHGKSDYLGSAISILGAANNYIQSEEVPKGHSDIPFYKGQMYFATQPFHDITINNIDEFGDHRGSHVLRYDLASDSTVDISAPLDNGVIQEEQGIIAIQPMPSLDLMVSLSHPKGDLIFYSVNGDSINRIVPGPKEEFERVAHVPRTMITYDDKVFFAMGWQDAYLYVYDYGLDSLIKTNTKSTGGFWNGKVEMKEDGLAYVSTVLGNLYEVDLVNNTLDFEINLFTGGSEFHNRRAVFKNYSLGLTKDKSTITYIPSGVSRNYESESLVSEGDLCAYNIKGKKIYTIAEIDPSQVYTGNHVTDKQGNIYFAHHDYDNDGGVYQLSLEKDSDPNYFVTSLPSSTKINESIDLRSVFKYPSDIDQINITITTNNSEERFQLDWLPRIHKLTFEEGGEHTVKITITDVFGDTYTREHLVDVIQPIVSSISNNPLALQAYPNPVTSVLHVNSPSDNTLTITSIDGNILSQRLINKGHQMIDMRSYNSGIYFVTSESGNKTIKIIKQ